VGIDISLEALGVAVGNANRLNASLDFHQINILREELPTGPWDIIVSNPPYVRHLEKAAMHKNVTDYEPALALFIPDEDPLLFYRVITQKAVDNLNPGGLLYFEINEAFGRETKQLLEQEGFREVTIHRDFQGKERMVKGTWLR
jgi:release factor glutamine methyltransferase